MSTLNRIKVLVTIDYEIFGNGTGDVRRHMIDPTWRMAEVCENLGIPLTLFFEVEEYIAFRKYAFEVNQMYGYNAHKEVTDQIRKLANQGHDLQLHIHPQWYDCQISNQKWLLNRNRLALEHITSEIDSLIEILQERVDIINDLRGSGPGAGRTVTYRAGGFWAQPCHNLLSALARVGVEMDSSVVSGYQRILEGHCLNYSEAPTNLSQWPIRDEVGKCDDEGVLMEVPVASVPGRRWQQISMERLMAKFSKNVPDTQKSALREQIGLPRDPVSLFKFFLNKVPLKLDIHNNSLGQFRRLFDRYISQLDSNETKCVVIIGHSKDMPNARSFVKICKWLKSQPNLDFTRFSDLSGLNAARQTQAAIFNS